jgi:hypothetical protein
MTPATNNDKKDSANLPLVAGTAVFQSLHTSLLFYLIYFLEAWYCRHLFVICKTQSNLCCAPRCVCVHTAGFYFALAFSPLFNLYIHPSSSVSSFSTPLYIVLRIRPPLLRHTIILPFHVMLLQIRPRP